MLPSVGDKTPKFCFCGELYSLKVLSMYVCMYVCMHESICNAPLLQPKQSRVRAKPKRCVFSLLQKSVNVNVGSRSDGGREFHSFGAQAAKLCGPKLVVRQASTCRSPRAAERRWRRLVLAVTGTHSSWRYCGAV